MFLTNAPFRQNYATGGPVMVWLNLDSKEEVDELYNRWQQAGAKIVSEPEACASSESPTWTTTNCAYSMTFRRTCRTSTRKLVIRGVILKVAICCYRQASDQIHNWHPSSEWARRTWARTPTKPVRRYQSGAYGG